MKKEKKAKKMQINLKKADYKSLKAAIDKYNANLLEKAPTNPSELYDYYTYIDGVYVWLKNAYKSDICVLCNEMRAILGHLSEYDERDEKLKRNLDKAYGHFRRLSIDTLKTLCNGLEQAFDEWIQHYIYFDYRNKDNSYMPEYVKLYHIAHNAYLEVQETENLGSDRNNDIIVKYQNVALKYVTLYEHHMNQRRKKIERVAKVTKINKSVAFFATIVLSCIAIIGAF